MIWCQVNLPRLRSAHVDVVIVHTWEKLGKTGKNLGGKLFPRENHLASVTVVQFLDIKWCAVHCTVQSAILITFKTSLLGLDLLITF